LHRARAIGRLASAGSAAAIVRRSIVATNDPSPQTALAPSLSASTAPRSASAFSLWAEALGIAIETANAIGAPIPLGRLGQPDDTARLALFLASDQSSWLTGERMSA
jgi:NAD(P)-dependent dehydrogenase (short-subunit alcohol dehydrogenase family)